MNARRQVWLAALLVLVGGFALYKRMTWTSTPRGVDPKYLSKAFDIDATNVGPKFNGHDIIAITEHIEESPALKPKSEFESSSEYERRKASFRSQPIVAGIRPDSYLAFMLEGIAYDIFVQLKYDADGQVLKTTLTGNQEKFHSDTEVDLEMDTISVRSELLGVRTYIGSNALGAKVEVRSTSWKSYGLTFEPTSWVFANSGGRTLREFSSSVSMPRDEARRFKPKARILVICKLTEPWYHFSASRDKPTIDNPNERDISLKFLQVQLKQIWLIDGETGEVVRKWSEAAGNASSKLPSAPEGLSPSASQPAAPASPPRRNATPANSESAPSAFIRAQLGSRLVAALALGPSYTDAQKVLALLNRGADPNYRLDDGTTPLIMAAFGDWDDVRIFQALLSRGADVNAQDEGYRMTALMGATLRNQVEILRTLLAAGADPNLKDKEGKTALKLAEERHIDAVVSMLKAAGAKE